MTYFILVFGLLFLTGIGFGLWNVAHFEIARISGFMLGALYHQDYGKDCEEGLTFHTTQFCIFIVSITITWVTGYEEDI